MDQTPTRFSLQEPAASISLRIGRKRHFIPAALVFEASFRTDKNLKKILQRQVTFMLVCFHKNCTRKFQEEELWEPFITLFKKVLSMSAVGNSDNLSNKLSPSFLVQFVPLFQKLDMTGYQPQLIKTGQRHGH